MSIKMRGGKEQSLSLDKKAWFLCKFLCRNLNEDNFEKVRDHISTCKGIKTRVKLSEKGWEVGYKPSHVRHFHHKLQYEHLPLHCVESISQDVMFINVLLCVFHLESIPGLEFEIVAYKLTDSATVKRFQDIFNIVVAGVAPTVYDAPGKSGNLTLIPSKSYHMGSLAPERWATTNGGGSVVGGASEVSYSRSGRPYGSIIPADAVQQRGYHHHQQFDDNMSYGSSEGTATFREVAVSANLGGKTSSNMRPVLDSNSNNNPNYLRADSDSGAEQSSTVFENGPKTTLQRNGVSLTYSKNRGPQKNNIALTSMDVIDAYDDDDDDDEGQETIRKVYSRVPSEEERRRGGRSRNQYQNNHLQSRSRSFDPFNGRLAGTGSRVDHVINQPMDTMSIRSQSSFLLVPTFRKVYGPRTGQAMSPDGGGRYAGGSTYQESTSRNYAGSEMRRNGRY